MHKYNAHIKVNNSLVQKKIRLGEQKSGETTNNTKEPK
jgi:hypothetical protein